MLALLSRLSSYRRGVGWVSSPGQGKDRSGSGKKMGAGPVSLALLSSEGWFPRKFVLSPSTLSFGRSQQQSSPKKMLVMATAPANSGQNLAHQLWSIEGGEGGGARAGTEVGLGWRPDHYSTVKVARFRAAAASWFVLRGNGEMEGRNPLFSRVSSPPLLSLVGRKVGWGVEVGSGCGWWCSTVAGWREKKEASAGRLVSCSSEGPLILLLTWTQDLKTQGVGYTLVTGPPPSFPRLNRGLPGGEGIALDAHSLLSHIS